MVIQRWQSVFLFIGAVLMVVFILSPFANVTLDTQVAAVLKPRDFPIYLVLNILIAVLLFLAIFMFKDLRRQKTVTLVSIVLIACSAVTGGLMLYGPNAPNGTVNLVWAGGVVLLLLALLMAVMAYRRIGKDQRIISSYDRLR